MKIKIWTIFILFSLNGCIPKTDSNISWVSKNKDVSTPITAEYFDLKGQQVGTVNEFGEIVDLGITPQYLIVHDKMKKYPFIALDRKTLSVKSVLGEEIKSNSLIDFSQFTLSHSGMTDNAIIVYNLGLAAVYSLGINTHQLDKIDIDISSTSRAQEVLCDLHEQECLVANLSNPGALDVYEMGSENVTSLNYPISIIYELEKNRQLEHGLVKLAANNSMEYIAGINAEINEIKIFKNGAYEGAIVKESINENLEGNRGYPHFYYLDIGMEGNYAYGYYFNYNIKDIENNLANLKSEVHIFDIKNKKGYLLRLDRLINSCVFSLSTREIFAVDEFNEEQPLVRFILPKEITF